VGGACTRSQAWRPGPSLTSPPTGDDGSARRRQHMGRGRPVPPGAFSRVRLQVNAPRRRRSPRPSCPSGRGFACSPISLLADRRTRTASRWDGGAASGTAPPQATTRPLPALNVGYTSSRGVDRRRSDSRYSWLPCSDGGDVRDVALHRAYDLAHRLILRTTSTGRFDVCTQGVLDPPDWVWR